MDLNHVAVFVDDLEKSVLAPAFGGWIAPTVTISGQPAIADGRHTTHSGRTRRLRTAAEPIFGVSIEDVAPGAPIQPVPGHAWHHVAIWADNLVDTVTALEKQGYEREIVGRDSGGKLAIFAYMISSRGPRLEIADPSMRAGMTKLFVDRAAEALPIPLGEGPLAPLTPCEATTVVDTVEELTNLQAIWSEALGATWRAVEERTTIVSTAAGEHELRATTVSTTGDPQITIIAPDSASRDLIAPVAANGWHHVSFRSADLTGDVAWLQRSGLVLEFQDQAPEGASSFAMLRTPDGTRVKLVKG